MAGEQSFSAITVIGERDGHKVLLYVNDAITPEVTAIEGFVVDQLNHFYENFPHKEETTCYLFVEMNTMTYGQHLVDLINQKHVLRDRVIVVKGRKSKKAKKKKYDLPGTMKVGGDDYRFRDVITEHFQERRLWIHRDMVLPTRLTRKDVLSRLLGQLSNVHMKQLGTSVRVVSKETVDGRKVEDDMYISFASALYWSDEFVEARRTGYRLRRGDMVRNVDEQAGMLVGAN